MNDKEDIGPTAHYTAYAWHVLGLPYAEIFATDLGRRLYRFYRLFELPSTMRGASSKLLRSLKNRHELINRELVRLAPDYVIELGAGLSQRGLMFAIDAGVRYLEVDLPYMTEYKARLIEARAPESVKVALRGKYRNMSADITSDGFADVLAQELASAQSPVVIIEGVLSYYEPVLRHKMLATVCKALDGRGALLLDARIGQSSRTWSDALMHVAILFATRGRGTGPTIRSHREVHVLLESAGFCDIRRLPELERDVFSGVWYARPSPARRSEPRDG